MKEKKITSRAFAQFVVKHKWVFIGLFLGLIVASVIMIPFTEVTYDLSGYLPKGSDADNAMEILKEEFDDKGMTYVTVKSVDPSEIKDIRNDILQIEGIASVAYDPMTGYKNGNVLFTVTLTDYDSTESAFEAVESLLDYLDTLDHEAYIAGVSASSYYTKQETSESILQAGLVIAIAIVVMLIFTSRSYFELAIMAIVFAASIITNMGTNFLFGGISYLSNLIALVLQLALSVDYSVILLHRYMDERLHEPDAKIATVNALAKGFPEIFSSSLTTIAGLAALLLMTLPIGVEIGIALCKSIFFSLFSVLFFMPPLLVLLHSPLDRSKHKPFVPNVTKPARQIVKARKILVPIFLAVIAFCGISQAFTSYGFNMNGSNKIVSAKNEFKDDFGTLNTLVVVVPAGDYEKERELANYVLSYEIIDSSNALANIKVPETDAYLTDEFTEVDLKNLMTTGTDYEGFLSDEIVHAIFEGGAKSVNPDVEVTEDTKVYLVDLLTYIYSNEFYRSALGDYGDLLGTLVEARSSLESANYSRLTFNVDAEVEDETTFNLISELKNNIGNYYSEFYITGESVVCYEMAQAFPRDNAIVSVLIVVFMLVILLFTFKNWLIPILLVLAIQGGMWINFFIPSLSNSPINFIGYLIVSAVQMGATIDYAIVLTNRYRTTKSNYTSKLDAMAESENAVLPTIITSGIILLVTGLTLSITTSGVVASIGALIGMGATASMCIVLFILPSILLLFDKAIDKSDFSYIRQLIMARKKKNTPVPEGVCADNAVSILDVENSAVSVLGVEDTVENTAVSLLGVESGLEISADNVGNETDAPLSKQD